MAFFDQWYITLGRQKAGNRLKIGQTGLFFYIRHQKPINPEKCNLTRVDGFFLKLE
jgi:hypothetical protein